MLICTDCTCSCKTNYHTITNTTAPILNGRVEWVSYCCLAPNEQEFNYIVAKTNYVWWDDVSALYQTNKMSWIFIVLADWSAHSPRVDMFLQQDTLFWFLANQSLLLLLNAYHYTTRPNSYRHLPSETYNSYKMVNTGNELLVSTWSTESVLHMRGVTATRVYFWKMKSYLNCYCIAHAVKHHHRQNCDRTSESHLLALGIVLEYWWWWWWWWQNTRAIQ